MRFTIKPTRIAEIEKRKKKEEDPSKPNWAGPSFKSVMIATPARPTTILSAKFSSINRKRRKAITHARFGPDWRAMV
jgi:hypothetical protein